jgi:hypothetical protein
MVHPLLSQEVSLVKDDLYEIINKLTTMAAELGDTDLEKPWSWGSYDREGIRFAFFRTYEELQELAAKLEVERLNLGLPLKSAQRILGQYHLAFRDLQAVLLGVSSDLENVPPAQADWSIRDVLAHIIQADVGFYVIVRYALERHRCTEMRPVEISDEAWEDYKWVG